MKRKVVLTIIVVIVSVVIYKLGTKFNLNYHYEIGQPVDSLNGVIVYYNGGVNNVSGRNLTKDNYNLGLKYQCVEFVKRYYYQHFDHKMPDSHGNAKDFFDKDLKDGQLNTQRNLIQFSNGSQSKPCPGDLIIFNGSTWNKYGHVAIISNVWDNEIEVIQQNPGPNGKSRDRFDLDNEDNKWTIDYNSVLGWLRKER
jgi:hypothetical protein